MRVENRRVPCSSNSMTVWCSFTSTIVPAPYWACTTRSPAAYLRIQPPESHLAHRECDVQRLLDCAQRGQFLWRDQRQRDAYGFGAPGAPHAVDIGIDRGWNLVVHHVTDAFDVDTARRD